MESDLQKRLPAMAYIEAQVLHRAAGNGVLRKFARDLEAEYGEPANSFGNGIFLETRIASLLYCLILIPKEIWELGPDHIVYQRIAEKWSLPAEAIVKHRPGFSNQPIYHFIHHLRNAVAHARISIADGVFCFGDKRPNESELTFEASISLKNLQQFLEVVGATLANLKNETAQPVD